MSEDILDLIVEYKRGLEEADEILELVRGRYCPVLDITITHYKHVTNLFKLMDTQIHSSMFICLQHRCPICHEMTISSHFTYIDDIPLTIGALIEFAVYLRETGKICQHEKLQAIAVSEILTVLKLNYVIAGATIQEAPTESETDIYQYLRLDDPPAEEGG